jgi:hypothetical protein
MEPRHHEAREHRPRTGDEPMHARSPLRMRLVLALTGLGNGLLGVGIFGFWLRSLPFAAFFGAVTVIAIGNIAVVAHRIRQGPHFQPGPDIPPYHPVDPEPEPIEPPKPVSAARRRLRYTVMMGLCLLLVITAWTWVRFYSVFAAGIMSLVAALLPPLAAIAANADSPILRDDDGAPPDQDQDLGPGEPGEPGETGEPGGPDAPDRRGGPG